MRHIRRFTCDDLFTFNAVNLDYFTETVRFIPPTDHKCPCISVNIHLSRASSWFISIAMLMQYHLPFYLDYLARWPEYCLMAEGAHRQAMGYIIGKVEGKGESWHGHITAVTVAPEYRLADLRLHEYLPRI